MKLIMYYAAVIKVIGKMLKPLEIPRQTTATLRKGWHNASLHSHIQSSCTCFYPERVVAGGLIQSKCRVEHLRVLLKRLSRTHNLPPPDTES